MEENRAIITTLKKKLVFKSKNVQCVSFKFSEVY